AADALDDWARLAADETPLPQAQGARVVCLCRAAGQLYGHGHLEPADELLGHAVTLAAGSTDPVAEAPLRGGRAARPAAARRPELPAHLERARAAALAAGDLRDACLAEIDLGFAHGELGDLARAERLLDGAIAAAERMGLTQVAMSGYCALGKVRLARRDPAGARAVLGRALDRSGDQRVAAAARTALALAHL